MTEKITKLNNNFIKAKSLGMITWQKANSSIYNSCVAKKSSHNPSVPMVYVKPAISKTHAGPATPYLPRLNLVGAKGNQRTLT